jgi:peptidoglycan/xylan/chitin deacetylase (PgdA/CDA1 family)
MTPVMLSHLYRTLYGAIARGGPGGRLQIFIYHRVLAQLDLLFPDIVDAKRFAEQIEWISRCFQVMPLAAAVEALYSGRLPQRAACITFDDGYADNAEIALPILQRYGVPATFFVASGFLDGGRMWNDSVIEALRAARLDRIDLSDIGLGLHTLSSPTARRLAIDRVLAALKYLPEPERSARVAELSSRLAVALPQDLMMSTEQVRGLHAAGMEIGGHTCHHPILAKLDEAHACREIADGKERLEEILGAPLRLFAYPNGKPGRDYTSEHVAMVRRLGFRAAVSTAWGVATPECDPYQLPRFSPWDRNLAKFGLRVGGNLLRTSPQTA